MKFEYIVFIVISGLLHAFYNFLMRRSGGNRNFLAVMFAVSALTALTGSLILENNLIIPYQNIPYVYAASLFYVLYQILTSKAYEVGNISALYPLTVLGPIFIPIWAFFFLGETISIMTASGICLTVVGAIIVKLKALSWNEFKKVFKMDKDYSGARFALAASFMYSVGSVFDKSKISSFSVYAYIPIILGFMALNICGYQKIIKKQAVFTHFLQHWKTVIPGGVTLYLSFISFRFALREIFVSVAVPIRQVSIIFAILFGVFLLKEPFEKSNMLGSTIIILGITFISFGI